MNSDDIKFSARPTTLRDQILVQQVAKGDLQALAELISRRSDPPIAVERVGELTSDDLPQVVARLMESLTASMKLDEMIRKALA